MSSTLIIAIFFAVMALAGVVIFFVVKQKQKEAQTSSAENLSRRIEILQEGFGDQGLLEERTPEQSFLESLNQDLINLIGSIAPIPSPEKLSLLNKAGLRTKDAHVWFFFQQVSGAIMGLALGALSIFFVGPMFGITVGVLLALLFFMSPSSEMRRRIKERSYKIDKTLPDMIDLFANCCIAGVSFDIAAGYILNDLGNDPLMVPIKEDFLAWQADANLGIARPDCWKRLADRSESKNIRYFTSLINQSEKTGGSVAEALFKMSGFFRERRKQQIESEIAQLPTKMSSQTIAFIVMPIILLLLGPVCLNAFRMVAELFGR